MSFISLQGLLLTFYPILKTTLLHMNYKCVSLSKPSQTQTQIHVSRYYNTIPSDILMDYSPGDGAY